MVKVTEFTENEDKVFEINIYNDGREIKLSLSGLSCQAEVPERYRMLI